MKDNKVELLLVGIGGYGNHYVERLLDNVDSGKFLIKGIVDPIPQGSKYLKKLKEMKIPIYSTLEEFYTKHRADLAIICSPIQFHCPQTCLALEHGSNVLCEKPVSATIQEVNKMIAARDQANKFVGIGYQWSFTDAILNLKKDIMKGRFGKPLKLKTLVIWPRNLNYYGRNSWAGKLKDKQGNWILDSIANNATAHYLHNMFFVLGEEINKSAKIKSVQGELYRANKIENYDTAFIKAFTDKDIEIIYVGSHASEISLGPVFNYEFTKATVTYDGKTIKASLNNGEEIEYGQPSKPEKLWVALDAVNSGKELPCGLEAASAQTICINGIQESVKEIKTFPEEIIKFNQEKQQVWVEGLVDVLKDCYEKALLPTENNVLWAQAGRKVNLEDYNYFKGDNFI